jgi:hypothetical protein
VDLPRTALAAIEIESVDVEAADVRLIPMIALRGVRIVDLDIAVVPAWIRRREVHPGVEQQREASKESGDTSCLVHLLPSFH